MYSLIENPNTGWRMIIIFCFHYLSLSNNLCLLLFSIVTATASEASLKKGSPCKMDDS